MLLVPLRACALAALFIVTAPFARAQCADWSAAFAPNGVDLSVNAFAVFDDGHGPALYVGGAFLEAAGISAAHVARWDGTSWTALGSGTNGIVSSLAVFDDGNGAALYAGGSFTIAGGIPASRVARWNGASWSALGSGVNNNVNALCVYDDGLRKKLYVAGSFSNAGGSLASNIASFDGTVWSPVGSGTNSFIAALHVFDDGAGPKLYAGGFFSNAGGFLASRVARWNGTSWSGLAGGGTNGVVNALCSYDDGSGKALYVGGFFSNAGPISANAIAKWNGATWSALGNGITGPGSPSVASLASFNDGNGAKLYVGGSFASAGGVQAQNIARWDGSTWSGRNGGANGMVTALGTFQEGGRNALFAGGSFATMDQVAARGVARFRSSSWTPVGTGQGMLQGEVRALAVIDAGSGARSLYAGGSMIGAGGSIARGIARWNGSAWEPLGRGTNGIVNALAEFDDGNGRALYAGGAFTLAGNTPVSQIARCRNDQWSALGAGVNGEVRALAVFDDGNGAALYVGGSFTTAGGIPAKNIAKWNGATWSALGAGTSDAVLALCVFDDGSGPALFVGGDFTTANGPPAAHVARWNGSTWSAVGGGTSASVFALCAFDDGSGPALFAGGAFLVAGTTLARYVARWDGVGWSALGAGAGNSVHALCGFDDGTGAGAKLYAGGQLTTAGTINARYLARWDGVTWSAMPTELGGNCCVEALAAFDDDGVNGADLFAGGGFSHAGSKPSSGIARSRGCGSPGAPFCFGQGSIVPCPCANSGASGRGCDNSFGTGGALLAASGWPSVANDSLSLKVSSTGPFATCLFVQSTAAGFPLTNGDGLRCTSGVLLRLFTKGAIGGVCTVPPPGEPPMTVRSAAIGDPLLPASTRIYQVVYRDANPTFCPAPLGSTWNSSNALRVTWLP